MASSFEAIEQVERLERQTVEALNRSGLPYALIGGNAVAAWVASVDEGATRATRDVNILARRGDSLRLTDVLTPIGLQRVELHGVLMFLIPPQLRMRPGVHVCFSGERVTSSCKYAMPQPSAAIGLGEKRVVKLLDLVIMKLDANRLIDRAHLHDMIAVGLIGAKMVDDLPDDLRPRMKDIISKHL